MLSCSVQGRGILIAPAGDCAILGIGQELLHCDGVQLIWRPHMASSFGSDEPQQPPLLCTTAKGTRSGHLPKNSRSHPVPGPTAPGLGAFWDLVCPGT